uniref:Uncharacterized protein n=1 Tax=Oryza meridionalis TaxID=40149 RepID=A0A0E0CFW6_9ORYZ
MAIWARLALKSWKSTPMLSPVLAIGDDIRLNLIGIKNSYKLQSFNTLFLGVYTMRDSFLVNGVAFKKTISYAGFEQQPKQFLNPKRYFC